MKKCRNLAESISYALQGIKYAFEKEQNLKIHFIITALVVIAGFYFELTVERWIFLFMQIAMVICLELMNTACENAVDLFTDKYSEKAKVVKDVAAGSVLFATIIAVINGILIFIF